MQPAQYSLARPRHIVLHKVLGDPRVAVSVDLEALEEKAPRIAKRLWFDKDQAGNLGWNNLHNLVLVSSNSVNPAMDVVQDPVESDKVH